MLIYIYISWQLQDKDVWEECGGGRGHPVEAEGVGPNTTLAEVAPS